MLSLQLSIEEMIEYLKRSSIPTILVEGDTDVNIYRWLEKKIVINYDILPCGGREKLLSIFERRSEIGHKDIRFLADKDMWYFTGMPPQYGDMIFTEGYSIENDVYDKDLYESLLEDKERDSFVKLIEELSKWFAFEVNKYITQGYTTCDCHINQICPDNKTNELCLVFLKKIGYTEPPHDAVNTIKNDYVKALRGKNLMQAIIRFLSYPGRPARHNLNSLLEISAKRGVNSLNNLISKFKAKEN